MDIIQKIRKKVFYFLKFTVKNKKNIASSTMPLNLKRLKGVLDTQIQQSHFTQALISSKAIIKLEPNNPNFQLQFIQLLIKNWFYKDAFSLIKKNKTNYPSHYYFFALEEAKLLHTIKYYNQSLLAYKKLAHLYPEKTELLEKIKELKTTLPNIYISSAVGQLENIKNCNINKIQKKKNIFKLQQILFKQESTL